ncbi:MAG: type 4a pilus biogenesis protein PilO [Candidatus Omnitrophota bacterium]
MDMKDISIDSIKFFLQGEKTRGRAILIGAVITGFLYFTILVLPETMTFFSGLRETRELREQIALVRSRVELADTMTQRLGGLKKDLEEYAESLPDKKEIPEFLEGMSAIAKVSGVRIISITPAEIKDPDDEKSKGFYKEMPITITAESGYHELGSFISNLESGNRVVLIEDLRIQGREDSSRKHDIKMTLKTYVSG